MCENITRFELFLGRDRSQIWTNLSHLGPLFERFCLSISIFGIPKWSGQRTHTDTDTDTDGRTHMICWGPPYTISPSGKKFVVRSSRERTTEYTRMFPRSRAGRGTGRKIFYDWQYKNQQRVAPWFPLVALTVYLVLSAVPDPFFLSFFKKC